MAVTRRQRNELFATLSENGVDPADFELHVSEERRGASYETRIRIRHMLTHSHFRLDLEHSVWPSGPIYRYRFQWLVYDGPNSGAMNTGRNWEDVLRQLGHWAEEVAYVSKTPDLWAELRKVPEILAAAQAADASNAMFTPDEQAEISARVDQALAVALRENPDLTAERLAAIEQGLEEVKEASTRVGRKDWLLMVGGTALNLIVTDLVPPHVVQTVFNVLITGIGHIFGIGGPPPMIGT